MAVKRIRLPGKKEIVTSDTGEQTVVQRSGLGAPLTPSEQQKIINQYNASQKPISNVTQKITNQLTGETKQLNTPEEIKAYNERARQEFQVQEGTGKFPMEIAQQKAETAAALEAINQEEAAKQKELQNKYLTNQKIPTAEERRIAAGLAFVKGGKSQIENLAPGLTPASEEEAASQEKFIENFASTSAGKSVFSVLGYLSTAGFEGINLADISGLGKEIPTIESDIKDYLKTTTFIMQGASNSKGSTVEDSLLGLDRIEENINWKLGDLQIAIQQSPKDLKAGKDASSTALRVLSAINTKRAILKRLALTKDPTELNNYLAATAIGGESANG
jgi:hypothetical protein